ncbi:MAG: MATE family efflux transporter [Chitinophagaceae bacterium]
MANAAYIPDLRLQISNRQILKIALPISFSILVPQINFVTNNIFLGGLGEGSLAAAGITGVYYLIFAVIGLGLNNGLQSLISRRAGENRAEEIGRLFAQSVRISLAIALFGILVTYFAAPSILKWALQSEKIHAQSTEFLRIRIWGLPFLFIYQMRNALLVGTNQSKYLIGGALAETVANIFFDYGFIYGKFGLPRIGFNGAAYASIIAEFTGMIVVFLTIHLNSIGKRFNLFKHFHWDPVTAKLILTQSLPLIFQYAISIVSWQLFYILIEHYGSRALAISNTMRNIFGMFGVFTWAFAATTNTMVSNIIGQGLQDKVPGLIKKIAIISTSTGLFFCVLLNTFPRLFLSVFGQSNDFITAATPVLRIVSSALVIMSFAVVWLNAIIGTGNAKINLGIEIVAIVAYSIYVFVVLEVLNLGILAGWLSEWLYWIILFTLSWLYIRSGKWKNKII